MALLFKSQWHVPSQIILKAAPTTGMYTFTRGDPLGAHNQHMVYGNIFQDEKGLSLLCQSLTLQGSMTKGSWEIDCELFDIYHGICVKQPGKNSSWF